MRKQTREEQQAYQRKWRAENRDRCRENARRSYYKDMRTTLFNNAKKRAVKQNIDFTISVEDINLQDACPVLNVPYIIGGGRHNKDYSPSLDRIDPSLGYIPENIRVISQRANRYKGDLTQNEAKLIYENWFKT